ncbi:MAG TPA: Crp/Fnr family transcriptional regulator [Bacillota bacterium]|nr:Crp/Fnr family transcriptional regulator [Bacillota bacterium]
MKHEITKWLGKTQFFKSCTEEELNEITKLMIAKRVEKREILFYEGEPCEVIYFIHKGRVKTYKTTEDGREQIVNILTEGDMLPHVGLFGKSNYPATASALDDCELYLMYVQPFTLFLAHSPTITVKLLQELDGKIRDLQGRLSNILSRDMTEKVSNVLMDLAKKKGVKTDLGFRLDIELTHQDIANMVGTTRETVSRIISQLKKDHKIQLDHNSLFIPEDHFED